MLQATRSACENEGDRKQPFRYEDDWMASTTFSHRDGIDVCKYSHVRMIEMANVLHAFSRFETQLSSGETLSVFGIPYDSNCF